MKSMNAMTLGVSIGIYSYTIKSSDSQRPYENWITMTQLSVLTVIGKKLLIKISEYKYLDTNKEPLPKILPPPPLISSLAILLTPLPPP